MNELNGCVGVVGSQLVSCIEVDQLVSSILLDDSYSLYSRADRMSLIDSIIDQSGLGSGIGIGIENEVESSQSMYWNRLIIIISRA